MNIRHKERWLRFVCGIAIGSGLITAQADYVAQMRANNPVGYWRLNEKVQVPAGDVARNSGSLGTALNGYYLGNSYHPSPGALPGSPDTAVAFDATAGTVVNIPYSPAMNPAGAFTVEAWFYPYVDHAAGGLTCAIASGQFGDPRSGWLIYQSDTGWNLRMYHQDGLNTSLSITGGPVTSYTWQHVVAVYDGTTVTSRRSWEKFVLV